jgi:hypothetical protein
VALVLKTQRPARRNLVDAIYARLKAKLRIGYAQCCKRKYALTYIQGWPGANNSSKTHPAPSVRLNIVPICQLCHGSTHERCPNYASVRDWRQKASRTSLPGALISQESHERPNGEIQAIQQDYLAAVLQAKPQLSTEHTVLQARPHLVTRFCKLHFF